MATNRDLLKEAIADAKAVKETAIANAKAALEEAFTPYLKEKLSAKLAEIEEAEIDEDESEVSEMMKKDGLVNKPGKEDTMEEVSLDELLAELSEDEGEMEESLNEAEKEEKEEKEEMAIEDMSEEDLKSFIEDVIKDMVEAGELEAGEAEEEETKEESEEELDEEISLEELLSELEKTSLNEDCPSGVYYGSECLSEEKAKKLMEDKKFKLPNGKTLTIKAGAKLPKGLKIDDKKAKEISETLNENCPSGVYYGSECLSEEKASKVKRSLNEDDCPSGVYYGSQCLDEVKSGNPYDTEDAIAYGKYLDSLEEDEVEEASLGYTKMSGDDYRDYCRENPNDPGCMSESKKMGKELKEAYNAINILKSELQEINLLNAKLLYTNKIFRNKSLTESQKIKVLEAFDKAVSKKEAQLVYETLLENFKTTTTKSPIKESLGSASKVLGGTTSKPIIENDAFARMRELAGIKK